MTDAQTYFIGIHGVSKERQDRGDTEVIPRADADRQTQEAVAAVLMEAARIARAAPDGEIAYDDILALAPDAAAILAKRDARVREEALMDAAIYFGADEETAEEMIAAIREDEA